MTSEARTRLNALRSSQEARAKRLSDNFTEFRKEEENNAKPVSRAVSLDSLLERIKVGAANAFAFADADEMPTSSNAAHGLPRKELLIS